ncbi:unnamed protein product [Taenia asiatica]|uniref:DUF5726 domain-containing protein n=1 Tax=Taenia asiatica TaxID=60517 RepID=A0A3P6QLF8_TAEAS|nr:unnamed protein product [Taenia asiatica]
MLFLHALPQVLFLSAIKAGVNPDSDIDHCYEILSQLAIEQSERSLAREFFHRDQNVGINDEDYARSLQLIAEKAFRACPPARVTSWAAVQFCAGIQPPTIAARLNAMKTNDLNQLVKAAIRIRQELRRPSLPTAGQISHVLAESLHARPQEQSLVNPVAFPDLFRKIRARSSSIKLLPAEGRKKKAIGETSLKITMRKKSWTLQFIMCPELVCEVILGVDFLRKTRAILNFAEGTFTTQQHKAIK